MEKEEFAKRMKKIFNSNSDPESSHEDADGLIVVALKDLGYDMSKFEGATKWYS